MEAQGNILKTLLIVAVIYTLALGAPVKRDTSSSTVTNNTVISNTVTEACAAATFTRNLTTCSNTTWNVPTVVNGTYDKNYAAEILWKTLQDKNFKGAVCEAVQKCLNNTDFDPQKCKLAVAAMELQDTIKRFIAEHGTKTLQIHCCPSTNEEEVEETLCDASVYTQKILAGILENRKYPYSDCNEY